MKIACACTGLAMAVILLAVPATSQNGGLFTSVHYIDQAKVSATLVKGGQIVKDGSLVILANRRKAGDVEYHQHTNHVFIMLQGEATFVTGGTMVGVKQTGSDQKVAKSIEGGEIHHLSKGDVITIPAKTPHWWKEVSSDTVAYYAVNIESR